ncbi:outer membrane protein [Bradyrhizobium erythrophlei]|uniref:outer membrane protein n=1 Tax=Bradyrhizobium erythrophlei TaxID=1437360 RepID=UPI0035E733DB
MKNLLLLTASIVALNAAVPAFATDLAPAPVYTKAPPPLPASAPIHDWSGYYIGINGGWGSSRSSWDSVAPFQVGPEGSHDATGGTVGGQIGYRGQVGIWVFGLEAQGNWADLTGSNTSALFPGSVNTSKIDAFGLFTGQVGYAANNALFYLKGGAAVTSNKNSINASAGPLFATASDDTVWGGTVGLGLEYAFTPSWSLGVEYDHLFMQNRTVNFTSPATGLVATDRIGQDVDLVTVRLNYKFGGPLIGKY